MIVKMGDKEVDLAKAFPLTLGDYKAFERVGVMDENWDFKTNTPTKLVSFLFHLIHKADESVTEAEVENIPADDLDAVGNFFDQMMKEADRKVNRPT